MKKQYVEIQFNAGQSIDSAIRTLKRFYRSGKLVFGVFNGQKLYSDIDTIDSAYKKVTGKTKAEFDKDREKEHLEYEKHKTEHIKAIPKLTKQYIEKGSDILDNKYMEKWIKVVPVRLRDLYEGWELDACLEIVKELNNGCELDHAKNIIEKQGHSGMSFGLVCSMVNSFCDRGGEFVSYLKK